MNKLSFPRSSQVIHKFLAKGKVSVLPLLLLIFAITAVPLTFSIPILTATKSDQLIVDNDADNVADPGDTIRYTNIITNSGSTDTGGAAFMDTIDPNTTLVAGSLKTTPIARNDQYTSLGNVGISVPAGSGVLVNDNDPDGGSVSVIPAAGGTANGGAFAIGSDGAFSYLPPTGFEGIDSFNYLIQDNDGNQDPATVFVVVTEMIWFIDNSAASPGGGGITTPFNSISAFNAVQTGTAPGAKDGDIIFLHSGTGNYTNGIVLRNGQSLIGQGATASIASIAGLTVPSHSNALPGTGGTRPVITNSGDTGITLGSSNLIRGLNVGNTTVGLSNNSGPVGTLTINEVSIDGSTDRNVLIANNIGTATINVSNASFNTAGQVGFDILGSGTDDITLSVTSSSFYRNNSVQLKALAEDSSTIDATITGGNTFEGNPAVAGNVGVDLDAVDAGTLTFNVSNTTFQPFRSHAINIFTSGGGTASGRVNGNTILGSSLGAGIRVVSQVTDFNGFNPSITIQINGNTISGVQGAGLAGIHIDARDGTSGRTGAANIDAAVTNNNVTTTNADAAIQVYLSDLNAASTPQNRVCLNATGNATQANGGTFGETDFFFGNDAISGSNSGVGIMQGFTTSVSNTWFNVNSNTSTTTPTPFADSLGPISGGTCATVAALLDSPAVVVEAADTHSDIWAFLDKLSAMRAAVYQTESAVAAVHDDGSDDVAVIIPANRGKENIAAKPAPAPAMSGESINLSLGDLNPGQVVVITFDVTVDATIPANVTQVCNQGLFTSDNHVDLLTDDTSIGGSIDPTCTAVDVVVNVAPVNTVPGAQTVNEDTALAINTISVTDSDGNLATTQISVNNGTVLVTLQGSATISAGANGSNTLTIAGSETDINATLATLAYQGNLNFNGSDVLTVISTDSAGTPLSDTDTVAITVNPANDAPAANNDSYSTNEDTALVEATVGPLGDGVLANDTDADGDGLTAVLDTGTSNGVLVFNSDGSFTYTPTANTCGADSFTYQANDGTADSNIATVDINVICVNDAPVANNDSYSTNEGTALIEATVGPLGDGVLANDTDADSDLLTAVLDSGTSNGVLVFNSDGSFTYTPMANFCGADSFTYHANDGTADSNIAMVDIDVVCVNDAPVIDDGDLNLDNATIDENDSVNLTGSFSDPDSGDSHTVTINWGDGSSDTVINSSSGARSFSATHQYLDDNPTGTAVDSNTITVTVEDAAAASDTASASITVNNVAPAIGLIQAPVEPVSINDQPISFTAVFTEPGTVDTHTAVWTWGDGNTDPGGISGNTASGDHTYTDAGVYTVGLTVTDDDTGTAQSIFEFVVVYDPASGFVTGGGWIDSPAGAYVPDPFLTGRANFGFVAKYQKGQSIPNGSTEFQFQVADLNFHSSSYDWLVIAGHKAMFKGIGTINGSGNYGFLISAIDAVLTPSTDVDLFRIKIWDNDNNDAVIYDNQIACSDTGESADPCTAIGGGSIKIHKGKGSGK